MGKKLDALLGRNFKDTKFKTLAKLAISRVAILKNQRQVKYSHAKTDVVDLLKLGQQESALLRVGLVIKDQQMIDMFAMVEDYCHLLTERAMLLQKTKECPEELKEAIASLIFASSRCGDFPELQEIRGMFVSRYGKDFAAPIVELRNGCGVNPKMTQKLSVRQPSLERRLKALKDIASEIGISLNLEEDTELAHKEKLDTNELQKQQESNKPVKIESVQESTSIHILPEEIISEGSLSESMKARKKYRDVAAAAQEAFVSAAYAAAAARAAVKLSRIGSQDTDDDDDDNSGSSGYHLGTTYNYSESSTHRRLAASDEKELSNIQVLHKTCQANNIDFTSEAEYVPEKNNRLHLKQVYATEKRPGFDTTPSGSDSGSEKDEPMDNKIYPYRFEEDQSNIQSEIGGDVDSETEHKPPEEENHNAVVRDDSDDEGERERVRDSPEWIPVTMVGRFNEKSSHNENNIEKVYRKPMSMRTRR